MDFGLPVLAVPEVQTGSVGLGLLHVGLKYFILPVVLGVQTTLPAPALGQRIYLDRGEFARDAALVLTVLLMNSVHDEAGAETGQT